MLGNIAFSVFSCGDLISATVGTFCDLFGEGCVFVAHRVPLQDSDFSLDDLSDCSSGSIEVCCDDLTIGLILSLFSFFLSLLEQSLLPEYHHLQSHNTCIFSYSISVNAEQGPDKA